MQDPRPASSSPPPSDPPATGEITRAEGAATEPRSGHLGSVATPPPAQHNSFWLWVMCLTRRRLFQHLGYQPSIAFEAAGVLAPLATVVLVLVTLFGALPVYSHVAERSPNGQGSIAMLERLVHGWTGKAMVLALLGFAATDFVITKTLSAADAAVHLLDNPLWQHVPAFIHDWSEDQQRIGLTMMLLVLLGATFLRGFKEVIGLAVVIVVSYLLLNLLVIGSGLVYLARHRELIEHWLTNLRDGNWYLSHSPLAGRDGWTMLLLSLILFPKLALGLSGFETGVAVMPLIRGDDDDLPELPAAADSQHPQAAADGGADHVDVPAGVGAGDGDADSARGFARRKGRPPTARWPTWRMARARR